MSRIYIAGPITSNPAGYRYEFATAAIRLRNEGNEVINPAENPEQPSWAAYMAVSLAQLLTCDQIALLPNWRDSRGARLEHHVASELGLEITYL
jgi:hypothetical protein